MQQTQKYKLNRIETSDPFSPAALNENADKLEAALTALAAADQTEATTRAQADAAETAARQQAVTDEATARAQAIAAEAAARAQAISAEAAARTQAIAAETSARQSAISSLSSRVSTLEGRKIAYGTYTGNANTTDFTLGQTISLGFTPKAVMVSYSDKDCCLVTEAGGSSLLKCVTGGFEVKNSASYSFNASGFRYRYLAFA